MRRIALLAAALALLSIAPRGAPPRQARANYIEVRAITLTRVEDGLALDAVSSRASLPRLSEVVSKTACRGIFVVEFESWRRAGTCSTSRPRRRAAAAPVLSCAVRGSTPLRPVCWHQSFTSPLGSAQRAKALRGFGWVVDRTPVGFSAWEYERRRAAHGGPSIPTLPKPFHLSR